VPIGRTFNFCYARNSGAKADMIAGEMRNAAASRGPILPTN
jgi:hypothetical protein